MFDPLIYLLLTVLGLTLFFGVVPLIIAIMLDDKSRIERLLDLYTEVFAAGAAAIIGALKIFRRKDNLPEITPGFPVSSGSFRTSPRRDRSPTEAVTVAGAAERSIVEKHSRQKDKGRRKGSAPPAVVPF
jgi:hypothetical protein